MTNPKTEKTKASKMDTLDVGFKARLSEGLKRTVQAEKPKERLSFSEEVKKLILKDRKRLKELALVDPLTGAFNRGYLDDLMEKAVAREKRNKKDGKKNLPFSVLMIDLDKFKQLNDNYGHLMGDKVLKAVVEIMKRNLERETDVLARYGGEEFVIVLENTDEKGASTVAERIRKAIEEGTNNTAGVEKVTASIGHATHTDGKNGVNLGNIVKMADGAAFRSKRRGRNRVTASNKPAEKGEEPENEQEMKLGEIERHLPADPKARIEVLEELLKRAKIEKDAEKTGTNG